MNNLKINYILGLKENIILFQNVEIISMIIMP